MKILDTMSLTLIIIGAINYGSIGLCKLDIISILFGDLARVVFTLIGFAGIWAIGILFACYVAENTRKG